MKYMGSKARIAKEILPIILKNRNLYKTPLTYVEPFMGGCNSLCLVDGPRIGGDSNKYIVAMWQELVYNKTTPDFISKELYVSIKQSPDKYPDWLVGWVGIACSYSGKWFGGYAGKLVTKTGKTRNYQEEAWRNVSKQIPMLVGTKFVHSSFDKLYIPKRSIVYCDPPYRGTTGYKQDFDHDVFDQWCKSLAVNNYVYVSEYAEPKGYIKVWQKQLKSSLSANGKIGGSKSSVEKLLRPKTRVIKIGQVCVYCGTETQDGCCGEVHHETGYVECNEKLEEVGSCVILESELTEQHEAVE